METYISKKRWQQMEKRVADLEHKSQRQDSTSLTLMKDALKDAFQFPVHQGEEFPILQADLEFSGLGSGGMKKKNYFTIVFVSAVTTLLSRLLLYWLGW